MGIGFVLLFWGIAALIVSAGAAAALAGIVYSIEMRRGRVRKKWVVAAFALPFLLMTYAGIGFVAYGLWCESVRDVDLGIGDSARVPLGNSYRLMLTDLREGAYLTGPRDEESHAGLTRIGSRGDIVAGEARGSFFLVDVRQTTDTSFASERDLRRQLSMLGAGELELQPVGSFYMRQRWRLEDGFAAAVMVLPPIAALVLFGRRLYKCRHGS